MLRSMARNTAGKARASRKTSSADDGPMRTRNFETDADTLSSPTELDQHAPKHLRGAYVIPAYFLRAQEHIGVWNRTQSVDLSIR